MNCIPLAHFRV